MKMTKSPMNKMKQHRYMFRLIEDMILKEAVIKEIEGCVILYHDIWVYDLIL